MSQEELINNFNLEREKHFDFFLPYYGERNWQVVKDNINSGCKNDWDVKLEVFAGRCVSVDEKVLRQQWNQLIVEIIQDMGTGSLGWLFGEKDWVLWGEWNDIKNKYPSSLYLIKVKKLREFIRGLNGTINTCISKKGWGTTWNIKLGWEGLIRNGIAEKLLPLT